MSMEKWKISKLITNSSMPKLPFRLDDLHQEKLKLLLKTGITKIPLILIPAVGIFVLGYDQGFILETTLGVDSFGTNRIHEFFHDARHASGFMCH